MSCNIEDSGIYGKYRSDVTKQIDINTQFSLRYNNNLSTEQDKFTFLKGNTDGWLTMEKNISISNNELDTLYRFQFDNKKCNTPSNITYGKNYRIYSVNTGKYIRCASGTCSLETLPDEVCDSKSWYSFTIKSASSNKKDGEQVCYGDSIYIIQTTNSNYIANSGKSSDKKIYLSSDNSNAIMTILPINGSLYEDPTKESKNQQVENTSSGLSLGTWKDNGCGNNGIRNVASVVYNIPNGTDWDTACSSIKSPNIITLNGKTYDVFPNTKNCQGDGINEWLNLGVIDPLCGNILTTSTPLNTSSCITTSIGEYGKYRPEVINGNLTTLSPFTLKAINWISQTKGTYTFIQARQPSTLYTSTNVNVSSGDLDTSYQFIFDYTNCGSGWSYIVYGQNILLKSNYLNDYVQCAAGTCSTRGNKNIPNCSVSDWATFKIFPAPGNNKIIGNIVCYGDLITITQSVSNADITVADNGGMWAINHSQNQNSVLQILPSNGSLYIDPTQETATYASTQINTLCQKNPLASAECFNPMNGMNSSSIFVIIISIIIVLIIIGIIKKIFT